MTDSVLAVLLLAISALALVAAQVSADLPEIEIEMPEMDTPVPEPEESPDDGSCMLSGGEIVPDGFSGYDSGFNYCNTCGCSDSFLICTEMACEPLQGDECTLTGGEVVSTGKYEFISSLHRDTGASSRCQSMHSWPLISLYIESPDILSMINSFVLH